MMLSSKSGRAPRSRRPDCLSVLSRSCKSRHLCLSLLLMIAGCYVGPVSAFSKNSFSRTGRHSHSRRVTCLHLSASSNQNSNKEEEDDWDAQVDYDREWPSADAPPDPTTAWNALPNLPLPTGLGIDVELDPMSETEAQELKDEAERIIQEQFAKGIQDIADLRVQLQKELLDSRATLQAASELRAQEESQDLMRKIDRITNDFLNKTQSSRQSTQLAAAASRQMEGTNRGLEMGTWGTLGGRTVLAEGGTATPAWLGSVDSAKTAAAKQDAASSSETSDDEASAVALENRIVLVADTKQDPLAKQLVPALMEAFQNDVDGIPNMKLDIVAPTATMPLGANNAACILVFCTSLSQASSLSSSLERGLRKTMRSNGNLGTPPTQLVGISTQGTERTDKFPYSLQNMLGKLDQRRQIEEVLLNRVRNRAVQPPLDYTLIKLGGELKGNPGKFVLKPGDVLDEDTNVETAVATIVQAMAYQPFARNATLSMAGTLLPEEMKQGDWDALFLPLEGPEIYRFENAGPVEQYDQLVEYVREWADLLAQTGKGLTTPVRALNGIVSLSSPMMEAQDGVQLLFLLTNTGRNYLSKNEERQLEADRRSDGGSSSSSSSAQASRRRIRKDGGIDVVVEITKTEPPELRVRARRCNYADDAIIKELSEETILKRLQDAMNVWKKEHRSKS